MATRGLFNQLTSNNLLYSVFPFTLRQNPTLPRARLGVAELVTHGVLQPCPVVLEKAPNAIVVRRTVTLFVRKQGEIIIFGGGENEGKIMWVRTERSVHPGGELDRAVRYQGIKVMELKKMDSEQVMDIE